MYNFFPQEEFEKEINIEKIVNKRINEIIQLYGADEKTISMAEKEVRRKLFEIYTQDKRSLEEQEIISTSQEYRRKWMGLRKDHPNEYKISLSLPEMMRVGLGSRENGIAVFCKAEDYFKLKLANNKGEVIKKDDWKIIPLLECPPDIKPRDILEDHDDVADKIKIIFEKEANQREFRRHMLDKIKEQVIYRLKVLSRGKTPKFKEKTNELISRIETSKLREENKRQLRGSLRKYGKKPEEFLEEINNIITGLSLETKTPPGPVYAQVILSASLTKE